MVYAFKSIGYALTLEGYSSQNMVYWEELADYMLKWFVNEVAWGELARNMSKLDKRILTMPGTLVGLIAHTRLIHLKLMFGDLFKGSRFLVKIFISHRIKQVQGQMH